MENQKMKVDETYKVYMCANFILALVVVVLLGVFIYFFYKLPQVITFDTTMQGTNLVYTYTGSYQIPEQLAAKEFVPTLIQTMQSRLEECREGYILGYVGNFPITYLRILGGFILFMIFMLFVIMTIRVYLKDDKKVALILLRGSMSILIATILLVGVFATHDRLDAMYIMSQFDSLHSQQEEYFHTYTQVDAPHTEYLIVGQEQLTQLGVDSIPKSITLFNHTYTQVEDVVPMIDDVAQPYVYLRVLTS